MSRQLVGRRFSIGAVVLAFAIALTGCSAGSIVQKSYEGFPAGVGGNIEAPAAFAKGNTLLLVLGGSSTCPPTPTSKSEVNSKLEIVIDTKPDKPCTMDFITRTSEIALDKVPNEVVLVYSDKDRQTIAVKTL